MWLLSSKVPVHKSRLLEGFRDCHCHLLPGVDDGVGKMEETMQILEEWEMEGVKEVWLTPHIMEDMPNKPSELQRRFTSLQDHYSGTIKLHLAAEHMMDGLFAQRLEADEVLPIGEQGTRLLVETSYYTPPMNMKVIIDNIKKKRYEPILAHPERYQYMEKDDYKMWKKCGVLFQMNLPSIVGAYGQGVQRKAEWLLKENMYDYCGTDTHSIDHVDFFLSAIISKKTAKKLKKIQERQEL